MPSVVRILAAAAAAMLLAGGGFAAGRLTAPEPESIASDCAESRKLHQQYSDSFTSRDSQSVEEKRIDGQMLANTILQNVRCFGPSDRAFAQTLLDTISQSEQQDAVNSLRSDMEECVEDATDEYAWSSC
ncbi:hypothetical protein ADL00_12530 [Streptomyces sp. AS58]|uniref:hypothetical protein n=1 Tax=Streptomyces sp. AS58 TaxID=1519489 RepID=UPI0006AF6C2F|nr:hypothetical protein [Streptomyces sp. AS58]KOV68699.1 hypothetical protein ADL00_12530 [Streptomyces sp. AS58]